jgi:NifU-like protein involved in Fe-S cluster formation
MDRQEQIDFIDVASTPADRILDLMGREIAGTKLKCATLGLDTAKAAAQELRRRNEEDL